MNRLLNGSLELLEPYINRFLQSLQVNPIYSHSTVLAYRTDLNYFLSFLQQHSGTAPVLDDFCESQVAQFLDFERQAGRSRNTLFRRRATLRSLAGYLNDQGVLRAQYDSTAPELVGMDENIYELPQIDKKQFLEMDDIIALNQLMEASPHPRARRDQAIFALVLECGISVGRLVELNFIDFVQVAGRWRVSLDEGLNHWMELTSSTSYLKRYLAEGRPDLNPAGNETAFFISQMGKRISRQGIWQILDHWGQQLNPPIKLSPRLVRRTAVHQLHLAGYQVGEIRRLLGHTNYLSTRAFLRRLNSPILDKDKT